MTHHEILGLCVQPPGACHGQVARLGTYLAVEHGRRAIPLITVYHCPSCDRVLEVRFKDGPWAYAELTQTYIYSTAVLPRLRRPR